MTLRDPGNFPKYRNGFDGSGRQAVEGIDRLATPYLKKRTPTAQAIKKGEFLYVVKEPTEQTAPFLWALVPRAGDNLNNPRGYRLASSRAMRNAFVQPASRVVVGGQARNDFAQQVYVGDDYVLRMNTSFEPVLDGEEVVQWNGVCWPSLVKIGNVEGEKLSLSADNVAGANVSFADVMLLDSHSPTDSASTEPNVVAMGWDPLVEAYSFGVFKHTGAFATEDITPVPNTFELEFFYGNTATRTMTKVTLPNPAPYGYPGAGPTWRWSNARCWCVGPGKLLALGVPYDTSGATALKPDDPPFWLRSDDFGRTWTQTPALDIQPYLLKAEDSLGNTVYRTATDSVCLPWTFAASPIGGGRVACVVSGSRLTGARIPYEAGHNTAVDMRWKFFVSDETGQNFVNRPWPPDDWFGFYQNRDMEVPPPALWSPQTPHLSVAHQALQSSQLSAGPGSFFLTIAELVSKPPGSDNTYDIVQRLRVLSTRDYGDTWTISDEIPQEFVSPHSNYQVATFAVARPYRDGRARGEIYLASTFTGGPLRVVRTSAFFAGFQLGSITEDEELLSDMTDFHAFDAYFGDVYDPPVSHAIRPLYVGAAGTLYRPRVHAGYPGDFDKP